MDLAHKWVASNQLSGMLTAYPMDIGVYDWAIAEGIIAPTEDPEEEPKIVGRFSHASLEHYHYEDGEIIAIGASEAQRRRADKSGLKPCSVAWIFNGEKHPLASGVFSSQEPAIVWIGKYRLTGVLTAYPIDVSVYDWAIEQGLFSPATDEEKSPAFVQEFTSVEQQRSYYRDGKSANYDKPK